jgi:hypothetical protein
MVRLAAPFAAIAAGLVAGPAGAQAARDPLTCASDRTGQSVRVGDPVVGQDDQVFGWVSLSQCAKDAPPLRLKVMRAAPPYEVVDIDIDALGRRGGSGELTLSAGQAVSASSRTEERVALGL